MDLEKISVLFVGVVSGVIALAIVAVIVGQKARTTDVLQAGGTALSGIISAAVSPVTGGAGNTFGYGGA